MISFSRVSSFICSSSSALSLVKRSTKSKSSWKYRDITYFAFFHPASAKPLNKLVLCPPIPLIIPTQAAGTVLSKAYQRLWPDSWGAEIHEASFGNFLSARENDQNAPS